MLFFGRDHRLAYGMRDVGAIPASIRSMTPGEPRYEEEMEGYHKRQTNQKLGLLCGFGSFALISLIIGFVMLHDPGASKNLDYNTSHTLGVVFTSVGIVVISIVIGAVIAVLWGAAQRKKN